MIIRTLIIILSVVLFFVRDISSGVALEKYWVFFKDKDANLLAKASQDISYQRSLVSERSLKRRAKLLGDSPITESDIPVSTHYLEILSESGLHPVIISRWLNAGSFYIDNSQVEEIRNLPFVVRVARVARLLIPRPESGQIIDTPSITGKTSQVVYGSSFKQNNLVGAIGVHEAGITGKGILIGMIDTGFNTNHESLINADIIAERDFINNDFVVSDETGGGQGGDVPGQDSHGTATFSAVGGFSEGILIGTAYQAQFALAKTEDIRGETSIEEDFWVAGIEWLDSLGADIVSSSLGYTTFTDVSYYTPADMNGNTAVTTIAADLAVEKGIVVVVSAGNEGNGSWRIISAPADGDNVLAVGAVWSDSSLAGFSSRGPTADGRTKPDILAQGVSVISAVSGNFSGYSALNGTSLSCPIAAGVAALILSAHPELNSFQVGAALKETAGLSNNPNNDFGWGVIDAFAAVSYFGPAFSNFPVVENVSGGSKITTNVISKAGIDNAAVLMYYALGDGASFISLPMNFEEGSSRYSAVIPVSSPGQKIEFYFSARDLTGKESIFPDNNQDFVFNLVSGETEVSRIQNPRRTIPTDFTLSHNYPNPFNNITTIVVGIKQTADISLNIYDVAGRLVRTIQKGSLTPGTYLFKWDGTNSAGITVASGLYFYRLNAPGFTASKKLVFVK